MTGLTNINKRSNFGNEKTIFNHIFYGHTSSRLCDKLDVYLESWVKDPNLTYCKKLVDLEKGIDGFFCVETLSDRKYYVPSEDWEEKEMDDHFVRVSIAQLKDYVKNNEILRDFLCLDKKCEHGPLKSLEFLQSFRHE